MRNLMGLKNERTVACGIFIGVLLVFIAITGCALSGHGATSQGPSRGDNPISGDLSNANVTINDPHLLYFTMGTGIVSIVGFVFIFWRLQVHHRAIGGFSKPLKN